MGEISSFIIKRNPTQFMYPEGPPRLYKKKNNNCYKNINNCRRSNRQHKKRSKRLHQTKNLLIKFKFLVIFLTSRDFCWPQNTTFVKRFVDTWQLKLTRCRPSLTPLLPRPTVKICSYVIVVVLKGDCVISRLASTYWDPI